MALSKLEQAAADRMPEIVAATLAGSYVFAVPFDVQYLVEQGFIEQNEAISQKNADDEVEYATRATLGGIEFVNGTANAPTVNTQAEAPKLKGNNKMSIQIEAVVLPKSKRGGSRASKYPFDALEVGQGFFLPNTEKHPDIVKSMASAVTNAMKKYDVPDIDEATGIQKTKVITVPKTGEKRTINATKHTRVFSAAQGTKEIDGVLVNGGWFARTA